jgi:amino acid permease
MQLLQLGIEFGSLPWLAIGLLAGLTFVSSLIGHSLTSNQFVGAIIAMVVFLAIYIGWDYYGWVHYGQSLPGFPNQFVPPK